MLCTFLTECGFKPESEKMFPFSGRARYDFYIEDHNIVVELDGAQHHVAVPHFNRDRTLEDIQRIDSLKEHDLTSNGIRYVRIVQECVRANIGEWKRTLRDYITGSESGHTLVSSQYRHLRALTEKVQSDEEFRHF